MKTDPAHPLLVRPDDDGSGTYQRITAAEAGWRCLNFGARRLAPGDRWRHDTGGDEMCVVLLGGEFSIVSPWGEWRTDGARRDVFGGLPHAAYLPPHTPFELRAESETVDIAYGYTRGDEGRKGFFVTPEDVDRYGIELRGGENASRQINSILPPGSPCHRLVCVEVYTPSGNWSSFPAHKHDKRTLAANGELAQASLEEVYFYKFEKPQGFALQKIYTDDRQLNEIVEAHTGDVVLVPRGVPPGRGWSRVQRVLPELSRGERQVACLGK